MEAGENTVRWEYFDYFIVGKKIGKALEGPGTLY